MHRLPISAKILTDKPYDRQIIDRQRLWAENTYMTDRKIIDRQPLRSSDFGPTTPMIVISSADIHCDRQIVGQQPI